MTDKNDLLTVEIKSLNGKIDVLIHYKGRLAPLFGSMLSMKIAAMIQKEVNAILDGPFGPEMMRDMGIDSEDPQIRV